MDDRPEADGIKFLIGPYEVLKNIGQGGMGEIFLAYDTVCKRQIALKRMHMKKEMTASKRELFIKEALLASQLSHPNIIPIYSIEIQEDTIYFTMPYLEGMTLKQLFINARQREREGLAPEFVSSVASLIPVFLKICEGVAYAHSKGFIHRDLKPSNIMIGPYGDVRILDWGLITPIEDVQNVGVAGTIVYLAPELTMGQTQTCQTEIYSLGLILYEMLALRYPFNRTNLDALKSSLENESLIDPAKVVPHRNIPQILSHMVLKCLEVDPTKRYQSVDEILNDLNGFNKAKIDENHLTLADAFFAQGKFDVAAEEYRRVADAFQHTDEGQKARFCAGLALLEKAKHTHHDYQEASFEFKKLHGTAGGPLEFLGNVLISQEINDTEREIKLFEEVYTRFAHHPLLQDVHIQLLKRLEETRSGPWKITYRFALLVTRFVPSEFLNDALLRELKSKWDTPYFLRGEEKLNLAVQFAFWLGSREEVEKVVDQVLRMMPTPLDVVEGALFSLIELEAKESVQSRLDFVKQQLLSVQAIARLDWIQEILHVYFHNKYPVEIPFMSEIPNKLEFWHLTPILHLLNLALSRRETPLIEKTIEQLKTHVLSFPQQLLLNQCLILSYLLEGDWSRSGKLLMDYPLEDREGPELRFVYRAWLAVTQDQEFDMVEPLPDSTWWERRRYERNHFLFNSIFQKKTLIYCFTFQINYLFIKIKLDVAIIHLMSRRNYDKPYK